MYLSLSDKGNASVCPGDIQVPLAQRFICEIRTIQHSITCTFALAIYKPNVWSTVHKTVYNGTEGIRLLPSVHACFREANATARSHETA